MEKYAFFSPSQHDVSTMQLKYKTCRMKSIPSARERTMIDLTLFVLLCITCTGKSTTDGRVSLSHLCHQTRLQFHQEKSNGILSNFVGEQIRSFRMMKPLFDSLEQSNRLCKKTTKNYRTASVINVSVMPSGVLEHSFHHD